MAEDRKKSDTFLGRWSRRKRNSSHADADVESDIPETPNGGNDAYDEKAALERAEMEKKNQEAAEAVDLDSLTFDSDYSVFLKAGVPAALKRMALRKLWTSNPVLANLDGLNDYDEDFNNPAHNVFRSVWQVGRGYLTDMEVETEPAVEKRTAEAEEEEACTAVVPPREQTIDAADDDGDKSDGKATEISEEGISVTAGERSAKRVSIRKRLKG